MRPSIHAPRVTRLGLFLIGVAGVASLGFATTASADPVLPQPGSASAADTVAAYRASGFDVRTNFVEGTPNVPLSECMVTTIRNFNGPMESLIMPSPVDIDVTCPNAK